LVAKGKGLIKVSLTTNYQLLTTIGIIDMFTLKAPAKINWFLKVLGLRDDGFHEIQSLIQKITLYDILNFKLADDLILTTSQSIRTVSLKQNLVYKAAFIIKEKCGVKRGVHIYLEKHIPISAGLGGGSSDAAATLTGLNRIWRLNLSHEELNEFACELGSDVPFFFNGPLAFAEGRGERITTIKPAPEFHILLIKPNIEVSTRWVYGQLRKNTEHRTQSTDNPPLPPFSKGGMGGFVSELRTARLSSPKSRNSKLYNGLTKKAKKVDNIALFIKALEGKKSSKDIPRLCSSSSNDLESVTLRRFPIIADIKNRLLREGAIFSRMSGSGATVFGVFDSMKKAENASKVFKDGWTAVVKTITD